MEVILLETIAKLGDLGDKVTVKSGYGRNFLIPQKKAVPVTAENLEVFEARRAELEKIAGGKLLEAQSRAETINALSISIETKAGEEGKLFGSVTVSAWLDTTAVLSKDVRLAWAGSMASSRGPPPPPPPPPPPLPPLHPPPPPCH